MFIVGPCAILNGGEREKKYPIFLPTFLTAQFDYFSHFFHEQSFIRSVHHHRTEVQITIEKNDLGRVEPS